MKKTYSDRYMQTWWRLAVLAANRNTCAECGRIRAPEDLECHHVIKRRVRLLRNDWRNGVPVCRDTDCHRLADGKGLLIASPINRAHLEHLNRYSTIKDYLVEEGITLAQFDRETLEQLKTVASGGYLEAS